MSLALSDRQRETIIRAVIVNFVLFCAVEGYFSRTALYMSDPASADIPPSLDRLTEDEQISEAAVETASEWLGTSRPTYVKDSKGADLSTSLQGYLGSTQLLPASQLHFASDGSPVGYDGRKGQLLIFGKIVHKSPSNARVPVRFVWSRGHSYRKVLEVRKLDGVWACLNRWPTDEPSLKKTEFNSSTSN